MKMMRYFLFLLLIVFFSCENKSVQPVQSFNGYAQGTTFYISYVSNQARPDIEERVLQIFKMIDCSMSLYDSSSIISRVNKLSDSIIEVDTYFYDVFELSKRIHKETDGAFNPAIYPLIQYWGFGSDKIAHPEIVDSLKIDSLLSISNFNLFSIKKDKKNKFFLSKRNKKAMLDFNAIAQGYTVDVIAAYFDSLKISNYMIELGGEVIAKGLNSEMKPWRIGIDKPVSTSETRELMAIVSLQNKALATSGSYRKFYQKNGIRYSHTIDPETGYPVQHRLLSASVLAKTCAEADAYATACMVMGDEKSKQLEKKFKKIELYMISNNHHGDWITYMSESLVSSLEMIKNN
jgi:thiamine biosynthesis lipoprotein